MGCSLGRPTRRTKQRGHKLLLISFPNVKRRFLQVVGDATASSGERGKRPCR